MCDLNWTSIAFRLLVKLRVGTIFSLCLSAHNNISVLSPFLSCRCHALTGLCPEWDWVSGPDERSVGPVYCDQCGGEVGRAARIGPVTTRACPCPLSGHLIWIWSTCHNQRQNGIASTSLSHKLQMEEEEIDWFFNRKGKTFIQER